MVEPPAEGQSSNAQAVQATRLPKNYESRWNAKYKEGERYKRFVLARFFGLQDVDSKCVQALERFIHLISTKANIGLSIAGSSSRFNSKGKYESQKKNDRRGKGSLEYLAPKRWDCESGSSGDLLQCDQPGHVLRIARCGSGLNPRSGKLWLLTTVVGVATRAIVCFVCADKSMFYSFRAVDNGQKLYMGNSANADIKGEGDVILKMTSKKELKLTNVLYVPGIEESCVGLAVDAMFNSMLWENEPNLTENQVKWISRKKDEADGNVDKYKARVVIEGFRHGEGLDYFELLIRCFINGDVEEEIYMNQPKGFIALGQEGKHKDSDEIGIVLFLMIQDEITYVREIEVGRFERNCGGESKSSCRTQASAHE
ncbi:hypothetical protein Tco_0563651 [Tanacetum coccineum]